MKRSIFILFTLLFIHFSVQGQQWYKRHHGVDDPLLLSQEQFSESQKRAASNIVLGSLITAVGTVILLDTQIGPPSNSVGLESIGDAIDGTAQIALSIIIIVPGVYLILGGAEMASNIKKDLGRAFPDISNLNLNTTLIRGPGNKAYPGISFTVTF